MTAQQMQQQHPTRTSSQRGLHAARDKAHPYKSAASQRPKHAQTGPQSTPNATASPPTTLPFVAHSQHPSISGLYPASSSTVSSASGLSSSSAASSSTPSSSTPSSSILSASSPTASLVPASLPHEQYQDHLRGLKTREIFDVGTPLPEGVLVAMKDNLTTPMDLMLLARDGLRWLPVDGMAIVSSVYRMVTQGELSLYKSMSFCNMSRLIELADAVAIPKVFPDRKHDIGLFYAHARDAAKKDHYERRTPVEETWLWRTLGPLRELVEARMLHTDRPVIGGGCIQQTRGILSVAAEKCATEGRVIEGTSGRPASIYTRC